MKVRFEDLKKGTRLWNPTFGWGKVDELVDKGNDVINNIHVDFDLGYNFCFNGEGRFEASDGEPPVSLFYNEHKIPRETSHEIFQKEHAAIVGENKNED